MEIKIKDWVIKPVSEYERYDLHRKVTRKNKTTGKEYEATNDIGYGMKLEMCVERIIHEELREKRETQELHEFLQSYIKERDELLTELKKFKNERKSIRQK